MNNILITSGGRRVSLVRAFKKELSQCLPDSKIIVADSNVMLSPAAQIAHEKFQTPKIESKRYLDELLTLCLDNDIKLIIPTIDAELPILSGNMDLFISNNVYPVVSDIDVIEKFYDKLKTHMFFENVGIAVAESYSKTKHSLPVFIKPRNGSGSQDTYIVKSENEFMQKHFLDERLIFFEYLNQDDHDEYSCDLYYDKNGYLKCVIPRLRIEVRSGEITKGLTVRNHLKKLVEEKLPYIKGARGCFTAQFFIHRIDNKIKGIEINPRFGGGFPLSYEAGGNFPKWLIQEYLLNEEISYYDEWEENLLMLRYDDEILVHDYKK